VLVAALAWFYVYVRSPQAVDTHELARIGAPTPGALLVGGTVVEGGSFLGECPTLSCIVDQQFVVRGPMSRLIPEARHHLQVEGYKPVGGTVCYEYAPPMVAGAGETDCELAGKTSQFAVTIELRSVDVAPPIPLPVAALGGITVPSDRTAVAIDQSTATFAVVEVANLS
jgi:hypothetical protein